MPTKCFEALCKTTAWKELMKKWKAQADLNPHAREKFKKLIRPNAMPKRKR